MWKVDDVYEREKTAQLRPMEGLDSATYEDGVGKGIEVEMMKQASTR